MKSKKKKDTRTFSNEQQSHLLLFTIKKTIQYKKKQQEIKQDKTHTYPYNRWNYLNKY